MRKTCLLCCLCLSSYFATAQRIPLNQANREYDRFSYVNAILLYEDLLGAMAKQASPNAEIQREARTKLADCYRKLDDTPNAERLYAELVKAGDTQPETLLRYAQSLASNGKYAEAAAAYGRYQTAQPADARGKAFADAYASLGNFYADSARYKVQYLSVNTDAAEFGPAYYKKGLVFSSARQPATRNPRVYAWDQSSYLAVYYVDDTAQIKKTDYRSDSLARVGLGRKPRVYNDDDTRRTANDTRTLSYEPLPAMKNRNASLESITPAVKFGPALKDRYHEGPVSFYQPTHDSVIVTHTSPQKSADRTNRLELYSAQLSPSGTAWQNFKKLNLNNPDYSVGHPSLADGNKKLYFASDMPGGQGGTDLYVSEWAGGAWGRPVNLGREINTAGDELFPFVDSLNNLIFSSDGHPGLGGLDVFEASLVDKQVKNLGFPINTNYDDFGVVTRPDGLSGFFASNRRRGGNDDDLYGFVRQPKDSVKTKEEIAEEIAADQAKQGDSAQLARGIPIPMTVGSGDSPSGFTLKGTLTAAKQPVPGARIVLINKADSSLVVTNTTTDGAFQFGLPPNFNFRVTTTREDCLVDDYEGTTAGLTPPQTLVANLRLLCVGDTVSLPTIYYDLNKSFIRQDAKPEMDEVVRLMTKFPSLKVALTAHTDSRASGAYNQTLSERRAKAAFDYLVQRKIGPGRLRRRGDGEKCLSNGCADGVNCTEAEHQRNRRTVFRISAVK